VEIMTLLAHKKNSDLTFNNQRIMMGSVDVFLSISFTNQKAD